MHPIYINFISNLILYMVNHSLQSQMSKRNVNSRKSEFYAAEVKKQPRQATHMFTFLCFKDCKNDVNRSTMHCLTNLMLQKCVHTQIACFDLENAIWQLLWLRCNFWEDGETTDQLYTPISVDICLKSAG